MGGHGHEPEIKIPSPDCYKIENNPAIKKFQERLAKEGLKDPWLRNEVWRYHPNYKTMGWRALQLFRGWKLGIPLFLIHIGIDQLMAIGKDHHDEDEHH